MKVLLATLLLATSVGALAGEYRSPNFNVGAAALGLGVGVGAGGAGGNAVGGNVVTEAGDYGDLRIVPPAIAPSVNTNIICPMVMQGSKAGSVFFFSGSGTHSPDIVPLCVAWHLGQKEVVERMTCAASKEYAKANPSCAKE